jgi:hypothetical protein
MTDTEIEDCGVAQPVERLAVNEEVVGSSPTLRSNPSPVMELLIWLASRNAKAQLEAMIERDQTNATIQ